MQAYDCLGLAYFYAGDLEKAEHYNDRMMRGKIECDDSVVRKVCTQMIKETRTRPKYEFYLNPELLASHIEKKQKKLAGQEEPRPDFGLSKAYRLLPYYMGKEEPLNTEG